MKCIRGMKKEKKTFWCNQCQEERERRKECFRLWSRVSALENEKVIFAGKIKAKVRQCCRIAT